MASLTLFPIKTKKGNSAFIGKLGDNTYFCADELLANNDKVIVEASDDDPTFFFLKRAASGVTVEIA